VVFPRAPIKDEELASYFSTRDRNLTQLMTDISDAATQVFGKTSLASFVRFNLVQYLFFIAAFAWQEARALNGLGRRLDGLPLRSLRSAAAYMARAPALWRGRTSVHYSKQMICK
jgi:hypothetical protein